jgi:uncharacterized membrane protein
MSQIDPVGTFKAAMPILQRNPAALVGGFVVIGVLNAVVTVVGTHVPIPFLGFVISMVATAYLMAGYLSIVLAVYDNRPAAIGDLFKPLPQLSNMVAVNFITTIAVAIGMVFLVIPGLIAAVLLGFAPFLVLEQNMAPMDAVKRSVDLTKPLMGKLIVFAIVAAIVNFIGAIPAGLGLLATVPMTMIGWAMIYRQVAAPAGRRRKGTGPVVRKTAEFAEEG